MRMNLIVAALAVMAGNAATCQASLRVTFSGTLSHFDAGYEAILSPAEKVSGAYEIAAPDERLVYEHFGIATVSQLISEFSLAGESGWSVDLCEGVVRQNSGRQSQGALNNPLGRLGYSYQVLGGAVTMPGQSTGADAPPGAPDSDDLPGYNDDIVQLPVYWPTVHYPLLELHIQGPVSWWELYGASPAPPQLAGATGATVKLNLDVFVPLVGFQTRTATFNLTKIAVVPEPRACVISCIPPLAWLMLRRTAKH